MNHEKTEFFTGVPTTVCVDNLLNLLPDLYLTGDIQALLIRFFFRKYLKFGTVCLIFDHALHFLENVQEDQSIKQRYLKVYNSILNKKVVEARDNGSKDDKHKGVFDHRYLLIGENETHHHWFFHFIVNPDAMFNRQSKSKCYWLTVDSCGNRWTSKYFDNIYFDFLEWLWFKGKKQKPYLKEATADRKLKQRQGILRSI